MRSRACTVVVALLAASAYACGSPDLGSARRVSVRSDEVNEPAPAASTTTTTASTPVPSDPSAYLHTKGATILDGKGNEVRLTGISWFGFETDTFSPHGLWMRSLDSIMDSLKALGFNMIRIPFATQMFDAGSTSSSIDFALNPGLEGKKPIEVLDAVIAGARTRGLRVVLDRHRPSAAGQSALWFTAAYSEQRWIDDWKMLAARYAKDPTVIGFDLHNEPHGAATWGSGDLATDWRLAAERAGAAVQAVNPDLLVIVEGVEMIDGIGDWWGGNLRAAGRAPVRLPVADHLVYSPHDYPASISPQVWLSSPDFPGNLPAVWEERFGYLVTQNIAPVWIGEIGTRYETANDKKWLDALVPYLQQKKMSFAFWCLNPDSPQTGGMLGDDWKTAVGNKMAVVAPLLAPVF